MRNKTALKRAEIPITAQLFTSVYVATKAARTASKGVRIRQLHDISIIGALDGQTAIKYRHLFGITTQALFNRLKRLQYAGYVVKRSKRYYLAEPGQLAYNAINKSLIESFAAIEADMYARCKAKILDELID